MPQVSWTGSTEQQKCKSLWSLSRPLPFSGSANASADTAMQICQLSPWEVSQGVSVQPALVAQAFEFAFKLSYRASLCGWFWDA